MRNLYNSIFLISILFVLESALSSCSENEDDSSAPSISIKKPAENDTIHVTNNKVYIEIEAENNANIDDIEMSVNTQSGTPLYTYVEENINKRSYKCSESFSCNYIYMVTKVTLIVTCTNEYHAWRKREVNFYLAR